VILAAIYRNPARECIAPTVRGCQAVQAPFAPSADPGYREGMAQAKSLDPFVCDEPAVEVNPATARILKQRMKNADEGRLVSGEKARRRIQQWLSKSATTKTR